MKKTLLLSFLSASLLIIGCDEEENTITSFDGSTSFTTIIVTDETNKFVRKEGTGIAGGCYQQNNYNNNMISTSNSISQSASISGLEPTVSPTENLYLDTPYPNPGNGNGPISFNVLLSEDKEAYIFITNPSGDIVNVINNGIIEANSAPRTLQWAEISDSEGNRVENGYYRVIADYGSYECFYNILIND